MPPYHLTCGATAGTLGAQILKHPALDANSPSVKRAHPSNEAPVLSHDSMRPRNDELNQETF